MKVYISPMAEPYIAYLTDPANSGTWEYAVFLSAHLLLMSLLFIGIYFYLKQSRLLSDTPTSKIRSCAQGFVELKGRSTFLNPCVSPLTQIPCTWWKYKVEKSKGKGSNKIWVTLDKGESDQAFLLVDETGKCIVHPEGADIIPHRYKVWEGDTRNPKLSNKIKKKSSCQPSFRYTESLLLPKYPLYVIGMFHTLNPSVHLDDVGDIIRGWKSNYKSLVRKYDTNQDGALDEQEWEHVINDAEEELKEQEAHIRESMIGKSFDIISMEGLPKRHRFIISGIDETTLKATNNKKSKWCAIGFFVFLTHNLYAIASRLF